MLCLRVSDATCFELIVLMLLMQQSVAMLHGLSIIPVRYSTSYENILLCTQVNSSDVASPTIYGNFKLIIHFFDCFRSQ